jgi:hypothetical protein
MFSGARQRMRSPFGMAFFFFAVASDGQATSEMKRIRTAVETRREFVLANIQKPPLETRCSSLDGLEHKQKRGSF